MSDRRDAPHFDAEDVERSPDDDRRWLDMVAQSMPRIRVDIRPLSKDGEIAVLVAKRGR